MCFIVCLFFGLFVISCGWFASGRLAGWLVAIVLLRLLVLLLLLLLNDLWHEIMVRYVAKLE